MTPKRKISKPVKIKKFLSGGTPAQQIAKQTGFSESRLNQIKTKLKKQGVHLPKYSSTKWKSNKGKMFQTAKIRKALITSPTKKTIKEFSTQLKTSKTLISEVIKQIKKENEMLIKKSLIPFEIQVKKQNKLKSKKIQLIKKFLLGETPVSQIIKQTGLSQARVSQIKIELKKQGIEIPKYSSTQWKNSKGDIYKINQVRKALITNPTKQTQKQYSKQLKVTGATIINAIKQIKKENRELIKKRIKPFEIQIKSGRTKPIPKLTKKQQVLLKEAQSFIDYTINKFSFKHKFNTETKQDFQAEVQRQLPNIIKKFNSKESSLKTWVTQKIYRINQDFNIQRETQKTGLSRIETKIGRKIEAFIAEQTNQIQQQKQRPTTYQETQKILKNAIKEVNNTKHYAKQMQANPKKFPKGKLTLKQAKQIINARQTQNTQQNIENIYKKTNKKNTANYN